MEKVEHYKNSSISEDYEVTALFDDIIMLSPVDCNGEGYIKRGSIFVDPAITYNAWRVGKVLMKGPKVADYIAIGDLVQYPNDRGIPGVKYKGQVVHYINEDRLFGKVKLKDSAE